MESAKGRVLLTATLALTALAAFSAAPSRAARVAGVEVAEEVVMSGSGETLVLNGAGVRKKFVIKVYVGALYLRERETTVDEIVSGPGAKRVVMHFLYKEVKGEKLAAAWSDGIAGNLPAAVREAVEQRLARFNGLFRTARKGDVYEIDMQPGTGTTVRFNGETLGTIEGDDFYRALLMVWLGDKPADKGLKKAWLGK